MSFDGQTTATLADDGYDRHYAERLWSLIPEIYRHEDGIAADPGQLRALVEIIAAEAATARRSADRLWADTRIDEADDWAVPYIGSLVGARLVNALNRARTPRFGQAGDLLSAAQRHPRPFGNIGQRYRRLGCGCLRGVQASVPHYAPARRPGIGGPITASPQWGFPDLRSARVGDSIDGPLDYGLLRFTLCE